MARKDIALQNEVWKPIPGYEGLYEVSSCGRVKSVERLIVGSDGRRRVFHEHIRATIEYCGYEYVNLIVNGREKRCLVHRLVAEAFLPNPDKKRCVDHLNTIRTDNRVENLKWVTHLENQKNPITAVRLKSGAKKVKRISKTGEVKVYEMMKDVAKDGFHIQCVCGCCKGRRKQHKGYEWSYAI